MAAGPTIETYRYFSTSAQRTQYVQEKQGAPPDPYKTIGFDESSSRLPRKRRNTYLIKDE